MSISRAQITEFKQTEAQIRRLATVIMDSNDAITVLDFDGKIEAWNHGAEQVYGYTEAEALKMNIKETVPEELRHELGRFLQKSKTGEVLKSFETQRRTKDGRILDMWLTVSILKDDEGNPTGVATTERDVTELKQAQARKIISDTLQKALLTEAINVRSVVFGELYKPATAEVAEVGGDFYALYELDEDNICMFVGDVSGHGLEAAKLVALVKNTIRVYLQDEKSPAEVLRKTNKSTCRTTRSDSFTTIFLGVLNLPSGILTYCNAGHPPPVIRPANATPSLLATGSPVIGILEDGEYHDQGVELGPSDTLIIYTDGLIEARRNSELFGEDRLLKVIEELKSTVCEELPQAIYDLVSDFASGEFSDDTAILALSPK